MVQSHHHEDGEPSEGLTLFECCNQTKYVHPQAACQRKSNAADLVGYPLYPKIQLMPDHPATYLFPVINSEKVFKDFITLVKSELYTNLNLGLNVFNGISGLYLEGDSFPSQSFDENLHL